MLDNTKLLQAPVRLCDTCSGQQLCIAESLSSWPEHCAGRLQQSENLSQQDWQLW